MTAGDYLARLGLALPLVIALILAGWFAVKRGWIKPAMLGPDPRLRAVATLGLGPGARLVAVEHEGRPLLIAVSRAGVVLIDAPR